MSEEHTIMSDEDGQVIDWFLKCSSIGRELNKHERKFNEMLGRNVSNKELEKQLVIVDRLKALNIEVCANAEK